MSRNTSASRVFVNVYDLDGNNDTLYPIGLGFYHSGLQINSEEYTFGGGSGIFCHEPKVIISLIFIYINYLLILFYILYRMHLVLIFVNQYILVILKVHQEILKQY